MHAREFERQEREEKERILKASLVAKREPSSASRVASPAITNGDAAAGADAETTNNNADNNAPQDVSMEPAQNTAPTIPEVRTL